MDTNSKLRILKFFIVLVATFFSVASARYLEPNSDASNKSTVLCMLGGLSMIGNVPDPLDCYKFYSCAPAPPGSNPETMPVHMDCPSSNNGTLFYDFRSCSCEYNNTGCYDGITNRADFFICAIEYDPLEHVTLVPV